MSDAWRPTHPGPSPHPPSATAGAASPEAVTRVLRRVRQTRDFLPDPVPQTVLEDILQAARWTGSAGNRQPWMFIVVTDPSTKRAMAKAATNTPHIGVAPVVIAVAIEPRGEVSDNFDEGRVAERMLIAATAHGFACGIGRARPDAQAVIGRLLDIPAGWVVRTMVSVGQPTAAGKAPKSKPGTARKALEDLVRRERFG